jgi:hypothetical protein
LSEIGIGAAAAFAAIRDAGAEGDYNDAYLSMLRLASNLLGLESLALAHDRIADADDSFEMCRDYANAIRDPLELGSFAELRAVPRHDSLAASSRPLLTRLGAVFGHALSAGELVPNANRQRERGRARDGLENPHQSEPVSLAIRETSASSSWANSAGSSRRRLPCPGRTQEKRRRAGAPASGPVPPRSTSRHRGTRTAARAAGSSTENRR